MRDESATHFVKRHSVLNKEPYAGIEEAHVSLKHEVTLGLC